MKIQFGFDVKSINKAVETLKKAKTQLQGEILTDFLNECCVWLIGQAAWYLDQSDVGANVIADIKISWKITINENVATLTNTSDKAVYVEFGVGIRGAENPHKNADETGYEYNVPSDKKSASGRWVFATEDEDDVDLPTGSYKPIESKNKDLIWIITKGTKGAMYAYNALIDLKEYGAKEVWEQVKRKFWG